MIHPKCWATAKSAITTPTKIMAIRLDFLLITFRPFCFRLDTFRVLLSQPVAASVFAVVACVVVGIPARRASLVDPNRALRCE